MAGAAADVDRGAAGAGVPGADDGRHRAEPDHLPGDLRGFFGTLGGAVLASIALAFITDPTIVVWFGALFAVLNGLFKLTVLGKMPLFYTATILLLYTANDLSTGTENVLTRVAYNLVGITIGVLVVIYPFPRMLKMINFQEHAQ